MILPTEIIRTVPFAPSKSVCASPTLKTSQTTTSVPSMLSVPPVPTGFGLPIVPTVRLPAEVHEFIDSHRDLLLQWFSAQTYARLITQQPDHHLVLFNQVADFGPIVSICADFYHQEGAGRPNHYTQEQLCRALYIKAHYNYSYRACENADDHMIFWSDGLLVTQFLTKL